MISAIFALIGVSLFVGEFPPTVSKFKKVYTEYKKLIQLKTQIGHQSGHLTAEELVADLEKSQHRQVSQFEATRKVQATSTGNENRIENFERGPQAFENDHSNQPVVVEAPPSKAEISQEWKNQFYELKAEVFRLNQRILELEKKKAH